MEQIQNNKQSINEKKKSIQTTGQFFVKQDSANKKDDSMNLNFKDFISGDLNNLKIEVTKTKKLFMEHNYFVIEVSGDSFEPFISYKRYREFLSLYKALKIKYQNLELPKFPAKFQLLQRDQTRIKRFNEIFEAIQRQATNSQVKQTKLLNILFAFLTSEQKQVQLKKQKNRTSNDSIQMNQYSKDDEEVERKLSQEIPGRARSNDIDLTMLKELQHNFSQDLTNSGFINDISQISQEKDKSVEVSHDQQEKQDSKPLSQNEKNEEVDVQQDQDNSKTKKKNKLFHNMTELFKKKKQPKKTKSQDMIQVQDKQKEIKEEKKEPMSWIKQSFINMNSMLVKSNNKNEAKLKNKRNQFIRQKATVSIQQSVDHEFYSFNKKSSKKQIKDFRGYLYIKYQFDQEWNKFFGKINQHQIELYQQQLDNKFTTVLSCYGANMRIVQEKLNYIEIWHNYDKKKLLIAFDIRDSNRTSDKAEQDLTEWYFQLKIASFGASIKTNFNYQPIGKVQIEIIDCAGICKLQNNSLLYILVKHNPLEFQTHKQIAQEYVKWNQKYLMPISNHYFTIVFELVVVQNNGWFTENHKRMVLGSKSILVADIMSKISNQKIQLQFDLDKQDNKESTCSNIQMRVRIRNLTSIDSWIAKSPVDYIEDYYIDKDNVNKNELKMAVDRLKKNMATNILNMMSINDIFQFKFPLFSLIWFLVSLFLVITVKMEDILSILVLIPVLVIIYQHPFVKRRLDRFIREYFINQEMLNQNYIEPKCNIASRLELEDWSDPKKMREKVILNTGVIQKLKNLKMTLIQLTVLLDNINNLMEKLGNLICWQDPQRTFYFLISIFSVYVLISSLPVRLLMLLGVLDKFYCGYFFYIRCYTKNKKLITVVYKYIIKRHFEEYIKHNHKNYEEYIKNKKAFSEKMQLYFLNILSIVVPYNLIYNSQNSTELIDDLATCGSKLRISNSFFDLELEDQIKKEEIVFGTTGERVIKAIINYIYNIPSNYYRLSHPKQLQNYQI